MAISKLKDDDLSFDGNLRYEVSPGVFGELTFEPGTTTPEGEEIPWSTNNIVSSSAAQGWHNTPIPPSFAHLVGVGHVHGLTVVRHAMVKKPLFPFSLAAAGRVQGEDMEIFAVESVAAAADGITDDEKLPGHMVSNSPGGGQNNDSIELGANTTVSGDVRARGAIDVGSAVVQGLVRPNSDPVDLVDVNIADYDPLGKAHQWNYQPGVTEEIVGRGRYAGNLTLGDVKMSDGLLYVDGDVTITGDIEGLGAIVATGDITVTGSMRTKSDLAALVSMQDIKIDGDGPASSSFQGLVYAGGSVSLKHTSVLGAVVTKDTEGIAELEDVKVANIPELSKWDLEVHANLEKAKENAAQTGIGSGIGGDPEPVGILYNGTFTPLDDEHTQELKALGALVAGTEEGPGSWQVVIQTGPDSYDPTLVGDDAHSNDAKDFWGMYVGELATPEGPERIDVFDLDLNTLISLDQRLEMMYHTEVPYER